MMTTFVALNVFFLGLLLCVSKVLKSYKFERSDSKTHSATSNGDFLAQLFLGFNLHNKF